MRKYVLLFASLTALFIVIAYVVKSKYYYYPYPNFIEYCLLFVLLVITLAALVRKSELGSKARLITGFISMAALLGVVNLLNVAFQWHPLTLNPPFSNSQSFEVAHEPYQWPSTSPTDHGYGDELTDFFGQLEKWQRLRALLVVKDHNLIVEKYFSGATKYSAFNVHSITKSITAALVGLAIQHDYIESDDELILPFFPEYQPVASQNEKEALTIKHLLSMRGGWMGGDGNQTVEACIVKERLHVRPDTEFKYFTGSQNLLSGVVTKATNQSTKAFADEYLFKPLGIQNGFWRKDNGYYCGGDESYYTARDLARFGELFLNHGRVDGKQLLDSTWVKDTFTSYTTKSKEFRSLDCYDEVGYGLCWWILKTREHHTIYAARGKGGQHIILIPDKGIVAVVIQEWNPLKMNRAIENRLLGDLLRIL